MALAASSKLSAFLLLANNSLSANTDK